MSRRRDAAESEPINPERARLMAMGIRPSKRLGQNFLLDPKIPREMVSRAAWPHGAPVIEIGAGGGALTSALLEAGHVVQAIEVDPALALLLEERFADELADQRLFVTRGDALELNFSELAADWPTPVAVRPWIVGNLPYAVTTPIVLRVLSHASSFDGAVLMVQREYGERMQASAGEDAYSSLSVRVAAQACARSLLRVGRSAFWPRPGVESIVMELRFPQPAPFPGSIERLERVLRAAFGQRRKTLRNALAHGLGLSKEDAVGLLRAAGCDPDARAETLALARFAALAARLPDEVTQSES